MAAEDAASLSPGGIVLLMLVSWRVKTGATN